jgi:hypothetical protein
MYSGSNLDRADKHYAAAQIVATADAPLTDAENEWLRHPELGGLITRTFVKAALCRQSTETELKLHGKLFSHNYQVDTTQTLAMLISQNNHFLYHAERFILKLTNLLNRLQKNNKTASASSSSADTQGMNIAPESLLALLNLQLVDDDDDPIIGAHLLSWLNHPMIAASFLAMLEQSSFTASQKIKLLLDCSQNYFGVKFIALVDSSHLRNLLDSYPFLKMKALGLVDNKLFELLKASRLSADALPSEVASDSPSSGSADSVVAGLVFSKELIDKYRIYLDSAANDAKQKEEEIPAASSFDDLIYVKGNECLQNKTPTNVRRNLWKLRTINAKELLEKALKNLATDSMAMAAREGGTEHVERLVLDYMFACNELKDNRGDNAFNANVDEHRLSCFTNPSMTSELIFAARFFPEGKSLIVSKKSAINQALASWPLYVRALAFDVFSDRSTALGNAMGQSKAFSIGRSKPNEGRYGVVLDAAKAAKQEVFAAFLMQIKSDNEFDEIRAYLTAPEAAVEQPSFDDDAAGVVLAAGAGGALQFPPGATNSDHEMQVLIRRSGSSASTGST